MKYLKKTRIFAPAITLIMSVIAQQSQAVEKQKTNRQEDLHQAQYQAFYVNKKEAENYTKKANELVQANFYNSELAKTSWTDSLNLEKEKIFASTNLLELSERLNLVFKSLQSSHSQFITENDEIFYFLHSMFGVMNKKIQNPKMDFTGLTTGGAGKPFNCVRYVLDDSPAANAGLLRGDLILKVNNSDYVGQMSFKGRSGNKIKIQFSREGRLQEVELVPRLVLDYQQYVVAIEKSKRVFESSSGKLGYVRYWCGGQPAHDAFEEAVLSAQLVDTAGLIVDLRDGYGGNSAPDFDVLYRPHSAYPKFKSIPQSGKIKVDQDYYDKPVVVLINKGSRSGKELLAFGIKRSGRGQLVGENTAGYFLGGRLFPLDDRASIYLAVIDAYLDEDTHLEKVGVAPDIECLDDKEHPNGFSDQLEIAKKTLSSMIKKKNNSPEENQTQTKAKPSPANQK